MKNQGEFHTSSRKPPISRRTRLMSWQAKFSWRNVVAANKHFFLLSGYRTDSKKTGLRVVAFLFSLPQPCRFTSFSFQKSLLRDTKQYEKRENNKFSKRIRKKFFHHQTSGRMCFSALSFFYFLQTAASLLLLLLLFSWVFDTRTNFPLLLLTSSMESSLFVAWK